MANAANVLTRPLRRGLDRGVPATARHCGMMAASGEVSLLHLCFPKLSTRIICLQLIFKNTPFVHSRRYYCPLPTQGQGPGTRRAGSLQACGWAWGTGDGSFLPAAQPGTGAPGVPGTPNALPPVEHPLCHPLSAPGCWAPRQPMDGKMHVVCALRRK